MAPKKLPLAKGRIFIEDFMRSIEDEDENFDWVGKETAVMLTHDLINFFGEETLDSEEGIPKSLRPF